MLQGFLHAGAANELLYTLKITDAQFFLCVRRNCLSIYVFIRVVLDFGLVIEMWLGEDWFMLEIRLELVIRMSQGLGQGLDESWY